MESFRKYYDASIIACGTKDRGEKEPLFRGGGIVCGCFAFSLIFLLLFLCRDDHAVGDFDEAEGGIDSGIEVVFVGQAFDAFGPGEDIAVLIEGGGFGFQTSVETHGGEFSVISFQWSDSFTGADRLSAYFLEIGVSQVGRSRFLTLPLFAERVDGILEGFHFPAGKSGGGGKSGEDDHFATPRIITGDDIRFKSVVPTKLGESSGAVRGGFGEDEIGPSGEAGIGFEGADFRCRGSDWGRGESRRFGGSGLIGRC